MERYVYVRQNSVMVMLTISVIFALLMTLLFFTGYSIYSRLEKEIYAEQKEAVPTLDVRSVEVIEERVVPVFKEVIVENVIEPFTMRKVGGFRLTAYCPCTTCCDQWGAPPEGKTGASGVGVYEGISFAVDPKVIPYGSKIYVEGVGVGIAVDCGGAIKGNRIDVYFTNHQDALEFGRGGGYAHNVYIIE